MKSEFIPNPKSTILRSCITPAIFVLIGVVLIIYTKSYVFLGICVGAIVAAVSSILFRLKTFTTIVFYKTHLKITRGYKNKEEILIEYKDIWLIFDEVNWKVQSYDNILIEYVTKTSKKMQKIYIFSSFYEVDDFRTIHSQFRNHLPEDKIKFVKSMYDLKRWKNE